MLQTQRFLFASDEEAHDDFANAQWSDSLPALIQAKLLQSFENYDIAHAPVRADALGSGGTRLVTDLRQFEIVVAPEARVNIALSAKIIDGAGQIKAARIFEQSSPMGGLTVAQAATAFGRAFDNARAGCCDVDRHDAVSWADAVCAGIEAARQSLNCPT